jgi:hypothetical protein
VPSICLEGLRKITKTTFRIVSLRSEVLTRDHPNSKQRVLNTRAVTTMGSKHNMPRSTQRSASTQHPVGLKLCCIMHGLLVVCQKFTAHRISVFCSVFFYIMCIGNAIRTFCKSFDSCTEKHFYVTSASNEIKFHNIYIIS